jgi:hypothetical protein
MKTSKKQFDTLFKEKLKTMHFEPPVAAQEQLLKALQRNKTKLIKKTWGKLSVILIVVSTLVLLQQKNQYYGKFNYFQSQQSTELLNSYPTSDVMNIPTQDAATKVEQTTGQKPILAIVELLQHHEKVNQKDLWEPLAIEQIKTRKQLKPRTPEVAPPICDIFEFEGDPLVESKASNNQTILCGQNKAQTKLIIAQSKIATFSTDSIARDQEIGTCRPVGFDENAVIQYTVFDKRTLFRKFQAESIHWGLVRTTKIAKPERSEPQQVVQPKEKPTRPKNTSPTHTPSSPSNLHIHGTRQYVEPEYEEYNYNIQNDSIIFISERVNDVLVMDANGTILSKAQIEITEPYVYYLGEKRAYFDQSTGKIYICVATLYHFNFYELEPANGKTTYLFHLNDVWPNPDFQIANGRLSYTKDKITQQRAMDT